MAPEHVRRSPLRIPAALGRLFHRSGDDLVRLQQLEEVVEAAGEAIYSRSLDGIITTWNRAAETMYGYSKEEAIGSHMNILVPDDRCNEAQWILESAARGENIRGLETERVTKGGILITVGLSMSPIHDAKGAVVGAVAVARDTSEQHQTEDELFDSVESLQISRRRSDLLLHKLVLAEEKERSRIAAGIHDDPLQVMSSVAMTLDLMLERGEPSMEIVNRSRSLVRDATRRLRSLVFELSPPDLERTGLVAALESFLKESGTEAGFSYEIEDWTSTPIPQEMGYLSYRVAQEGVRNIRKHAKASMVRAAIESNDEGVTIRIEDDGIGFSPTEAIPTSHFGLRDMRDRVELAGGWLRHTSAPGQGTTVEFWMPLPRAQEIA